MFKAFRLVFLLSPLLLGGCVVGEGVAHMVKLVGNKSGRSDPSPAAAPTAAAPAMAEPDAPPPAAAAPRDEITVESLPPRG